MNLAHQSDLEVVNPATGEVLARLDASAPEDVAVLVGQAQQGQQAMSRMPAHERAELLLAVADALEREVDEFARTLAAENGKPLEQTRGETLAAIRIFRACAGEATRLFGRQVPMDAVPGLEDSLAVTMRGPIGVVAAIVPFNYPVELYAHKAAAAIAAGNAVIVQPPSRCPLSVIRIHELFVQAGAPCFAHQVVLGGVPVTQALASAEGVAAVSLTGSTVAGRDVGRLASATFKKVMLELGGNDALIVCDDADLDLAVDAVVLGRLARGNGQICCAVKRVYVAQPLHDSFVDVLQARAAKLVVGDQLEEGTEVGPLISQHAASAVDTAVARLVSDGARLVQGGQRDGAFFQPTVLSDVVASSPALQEEIFGPVVPVVSFVDPLEAVALANESPYGLQAAVFTRDLARAFALARRLDVGGVVINGSTALRAENVPFGGTKATGGYRESVHDTVKDFTVEKTLIVRGALG